MQIRSRRSSWALLLLLLFLAACGDGTTEHIDFDPAEEDQWTHAVSHILIEVGPKRPPARARKLAYDVYAQIRQGRPFEELAATYSDHESKTEGGFIGFVRTGAPTRFSGAVQALEVGSISRPVETKLGYQIIKRLSFEEGKRLEQRYMCAAYGFILPWKGEPGGRLEKDAAAKEAERVVAALRRGDTNLLVERERLVPPQPDQRAGAFLFVSAKRKQLKGVIEVIMRLKPGEYADPLELPKGFGIVQRRPILRAIVKHILVSDAMAPERPLKVSRAPREAAALIKSAMAELNGSTASWAAVVKKYTDDDTEQRPGGMLGVVTNGDLPPSLEAATFDTKPGTINPRIVQSPRGLHILWRVK